MFIQNKYQSRHEILQQGFQVIHHHYLFSQEMLSNHIFLPSLHQVTLPPQPPTTAPYSHLYPILSLLQVSFYQPAHQKLMCI